MNSSNKKEEENLLLEALNILFDKESISEKINDLSYSIPEKIFEDEEIPDEKEISIECPECGGHIHEKENNCKDCGFSFGEIISCIYMVENICGIDGMGCQIEGFDYEKCDKFRKEKI